MSIAASQRSTHIRAASDVPPGPWERLRRSMAYFSVGYLMLGTLNRWPGVVRGVRPMVLWVAWHTARVTRRDLMLNARYLLGRSATPQQLRSHCKRVLGNFYDFIYELGSSRHRSFDDLTAQIANVYGREYYDRARAAGKGAILVTAHLGAYEVGMASLRQIEPRVHVVFRRDPMSRFEQLRTQQHERLGVHEATVGDGLHVWMQLRDALQNDEVVLMQGDRVMPDQSGERLAFCGGHMQFPPGPVKLALATGAPIVPIFAIRRSDGRVDIHLEQPVEPRQHQLDTDEVLLALREVAAVIERYVKQYPDQWLRVQYAFCDEPEQGEAA